MNKFEIELKSKETNSFGNEFLYAVGTKDFEADVTVFERTGVNFVHKHFCTKGGDKLWHFRFWDDLQQSVLKYHNKSKEELK